MAGRWSSASFRHFSNQTPLLGKVLSVDGILLEMMFCSMISGDCGHGRCRE